MLRIGQIDYLNCVPIFTQLQRQAAATDYRFVRGVPAVLNGLLRQGEIDLCPSSSIEYGRFPDRYYLLPDLSISADGPVKSVLLFSRLPIEELNGATIGLTGESATSVALVKILLAKRYSFTNSFVPFTGTVADGLGHCGALLLIGDAALKESLTGGDFRVYDLGELWRNFTGLPFVFALWLVRREAVESQPAAVRRLLGLLLDAKREAFLRIEKIAADYQENEWIDRIALEDYWRTISYDLTPRYREGVELYYRYAKECGLLAEAPPLRIFS